MAQPPLKVGIAEVDKLVMLAIEQGLTFPPAGARWKVLAWAAEAMELRRTDPARFARDGLRAVHAAHFGPSTPRTV